MSLSLFTTTGGIEILSSDFTGRSHLLSGTGAPGGDSGFQDAAPIGSLYMRTDVAGNALQTYSKSTATNSTADWIQLANKDYVDTAVTGLSWREPVRVKDATTYANVAALPTGGTIDSVALADGDRVLFTDLTSGADNVYVWNAGGSSWSVDVNTATDGDALLVQEGTSADQQWVFDGAAWVQFGGASSNAELGFIRSFIGKTGAGSEMPTYSSALVVAQSSSLETAVGALDAGIGSRLYTNDFVIADSEIITLSLDKLDTAIGDRLYTANNVVVDGERLTLSINSLDAAFGNRLYTANNNIADSETITASLEKLDLAVGLRTYTQNFVVADNESAAASIEKLDLAVGALQVQNVINNFPNVTTVTVVDTVPLADADNVQWKVVCVNAGVSTNRYAATVDALHDGSSVVDHSVYAVNKIGANIAGLVLTVAINGSNLELRVTSTTAVNVGVRRLSAIAAV
jgi:hypothetical protein